MSVRRAYPRVTGDKREEVERRAGRKSALLVRKDIVAAGEEGHDCSDYILFGSQDMYFKLIRTVQSRMFPGSHL